MLEINSFENEFPGTSDYYKINNHFHNHENNDSAQIV